MSFAPAPTSTRATNSCTISECPFSATDGSGIKVPRPLNLHQRVVSLRPKNSCITSECLFLAAYERGDCPGNLQMLVRYGWTDSTIISAAPSRDGTRLVTGSFHQTVEVWDTISCSKLLELRGHQGWAHSVEMSPDGTYIVSGSHASGVRFLAQKLSQYCEVTRVLSYQWPSLPTALA